MRVSIQGRKHNAGRSTLLSGDLGDAVKKKGKAKVPQSGKITRALEENGSVHITAQAPKFRGNNYDVVVTLTRKEIIALAKSSLEGCTLGEVFK